VTGNRQCKDGDITRRWAVAGKGIARKSKLDIIEDLIKGRLIELEIDGWHAKAFPLNLICAERRLMSPTVIAFKIHLLDRVTALFNQYKDASASI
jgi:DNA-binding transcriptional LysR family regulator